MYLSNKFYFLFILFLWANPAKSQHRTVDSLIHRLSDVQEDTNKVEFLLDIVREYYTNTDYSQAQIYLKQSFALSQKLNYKKGQISCYSVSGRIQKNLGNYTEAQQQYIEALTISEAIKDTDCIASSYNNLGNLLIPLKKFDQAIQYLESSLQLYQKIGQIKKSAYPMSNLGKIFQAQHKDEKAMKYYKTALGISQKHNDDFEVAQTYKRVASMYIREEAYTQALNYCDSTFALSEKNGYRNLIADIYDIRGQIYIAVKNYPRARIEIINGLNLYKELQVKPSIQNSYRQLYDIDSIQGNFADAFQHYKLYHMYNDSLLNYENMLKMERQKMQYDVYKKEIQSSLEQENKEQESENKLIILGLTFGMALLAGFLVFMNFRRHQKLKREFEIEQTKNRIRADLHDDIGSTLSSISMSAELATKRLAKNENVSELVNTIQAASRSMMTNMNDMVWSLNSANETMEQLLNRLNNYCALSLSPLGIEFEIESGKDIEQFKPNAIQLKEIYFIGKEAINNSMKYAQSKSIHLVFSMKESNLCMEVKDDGIGFDPLGRIVGMGGEGVKNMKARAQKMNGKLEILSEESKGTVVHLLLPVQARK